MINFFSFDNLCGLIDLFLSGFWPDFFFLDEFNCLLCFFYLFKAFSSMTDSSAIDDIIYKGLLTM